MPPDALGHFPGCYHYGVESESRLREIYSAHRAYVVLSFTNYSLLPAEIMAAGGRVLDLDLPCNRLVQSSFDTDRYFLSAPDPYAIADRVVRMCGMPDTKSAPSSLPDWKTEYGKVGRAILSQFGRSA